LFHGPVLPFFKGIAVAYPLGRLTRFNWDPHSDTAVMALAGGLYKRLFTQTYVIIGLAITRLALISPDTLSGSRSILQASNLDAVLDRKHESPQRELWQPGHAAPCRNRRCEPDPLYCDPSMPQSGGSCFLFRTNALENDAPCY